MYDFQWSDAVTVQPAERLPVTNCPQRSLFMKSILEDIKNQDYKKVYLLYGDEAYLKQQYKHRLLQALVSEEDTMNFSRFEGKGINVREVIDLAETMPFFSDRRVILMENTGFFKTKSEELAEYMSTLPDYICFLFVEEATILPPI